MKSISGEELRELVEYKDGNLYWINPTNFRLNKGDKLGCIHKSGYIITSLFNKYYSLHRLIWLYHYDYYPENDIDHIDNNKTNNRIENLREVSTSCNCRNAIRIKKTKSGIKGVSWSKTNKMWYSHIYNGVSSKHLGYYKSIVEAACARLFAEQCLDWISCSSQEELKKFIQTTEENYICM